MLASASTQNRQESEELESALQSIAQRWHGDLASYLDALARAKEAASSKSDEDKRIPPAIENARMMRNR